MRAVQLQFTGIYVLYSEANLDRLDIVHDKYCTILSPNTDLLPGISFGTVLENCSITFNNT